MSDPWGKNCVGLDRVSVFYDGRLTPIRINHPEGVMVDPHGNVWCGGEFGELCRISADGQKLERLNQTGGYALGLARSDDGRIFMCDYGLRCIVVFNSEGKELARWRGKEANDEMRVPNSCVVDEVRQCLYVSDTRMDGPGIWRLNLQTGTGGWWLQESCKLANGMVLSPKGDKLFLVESALPGVSVIPIRSNGSAGEKQLFVELPDTEPDGLAFSPSGELYVSIYDPSRIYRITADRRPVLIVEDTTTRKLHHPTNIAFRGDREMFVANLGGWHISRVELDEKVR